MFSSIVNECVENRGEGVHKTVTGFVEGHHVCVCGVQVNTGYIDYTL